MNNLYNVVDVTVPTADVITVAYTRWEADD